MNITKRKISSQLVTFCLLLSTTEAFLLPSQSSKLLIGSGAQGTYDQPIEMDFDDEFPQPANSKLSKEWENFMVGKPTFFEAAANRKAKEELIIEDPVITKLAPQWTDSCANKEDRLNETWVNIIVANQHNFPRHVIEEDAKDRGMFIRMLEAKAMGLPHWPPPPGDEYELGKSRRKRSIGIKGKSAISVNALSSGKSPLIFKKNASPRYGPSRKTTFSIGRQRYLINPYGAGGVNRYYFSPQEQVMQHAAGATTATPLSNETPKLSETMDKLTDSLLANDIRLTWRINSALHQVTDLRKSMKKLINLIGGDKLPEEAESSLISAIQKQQKWLPTAQSLIRENKQGKEYDSYSVLRNISYYLQFYDAAFEQMSHEKVNLEKKHGQTFRKLVRKGLELSCDAELMMKHIQDLKKDKSELMAQIVREKLSMDDINRPNQPKRIHPRSLRLADKQSHYNASTFEAPFFKPLEHKQIGGQASIFVSREVMPESQRKLSSAIERRIRDTRIFEELERFLTFYESVLNNIYV